MECLTWAAPIVPGKLDAWRDFDAAMRGPRAEEHRASRQALGMVREVSSLLRTPDGTDLVCLFHEAEDLGKAFRQLAESTEPYDVWFRERLVEIHGLTPEMLAAGPPPAELHLDFRAGG
ncbi:MAG TPA: hypothetical protein VGB14_19675 [Acidimicrobiales bacterium]|jgi:hypothetical protein